MTQQKEAPKARVNTSKDVNVPDCPECGSSKTWLDGKRYVQGQAIQRYICRICGYRFSENNYKQSQTTNSRQICALETKRVKNLVKVETRTEAALRESTQEQKGELVAFGWHMKKRGLSDATIKQRMYRLNVLVKKGANLEDPETVETILAVSKWSPANKKIFANCYKAFTTYMKIEWQPPKITVSQKEPFLPLEEEVQQLIAGCGKRTSTLLQLLFETGCRIGEAALLQWRDIDFKSRNLRINCPEKGGNARTIQLSHELLAMLKALPKREDVHIFNPKVRTLSSTFLRQRNRLAKHLQNPRLKQIHFHTLRHLRATLTYYKTGGDILKVKYLLGHKRLDTTGRYAHYQAFRNEEYMVKRPQTRVEEDQLIEDGFQFVRYDEKHNEAVYRKRK
jgi:integrase